MTIEEAIEWMQEEKASFERAPDLNGCPMTECWQKAIDVYDMAISALRQREHFREVTKKVEPLTMDEMRQMPIRDWVWIEVLTPDSFRSKETVSAYYRKYDGYKTDEIFWCGYPGLGFGFDYSDYGKTWLAYRQKPEEGTV